MSLAGFFLYNYLKMKQMEQPQNDKVQYAALPQLEVERPAGKTFV